MIRDQKWRARQIANGVSAVVLDIFEILDDGEEPS
jgi:hypothetical protein